MTMIFYDKNKILSYDDPMVKFMNPEYCPKPSIGEHVVLDGITYKVCDIVINYDKEQIFVMIDMV